MLAAYRLSFKEIQETGRSYNEPIHFTALILPRFASTKYFSKRQKKRPFFRLIAIFIFKTNVPIREVGRAQDRGFCSRDI